MMKKLIGSLLAVLLVFSLVACGNKNDENKNALDTVKERGTLIVAMEGNWSPWTYYNENNELVGYDVEVAKAIANKLGVAVQYEIGEWDGLLEGVSSGRYDMMVNGCNITPKREEAYSFSNPYAYIKTVVIVGSEDNSINSFEDLKDKKTANTITSIYAQLAEKYGAKVTGVDDLYQTIDLLLQGRIDATLNAEDTFADYISKHPDAPIKVAVASEDADPIGIPMKKSEDTSLVDAVNKALEELKADGTLTEISNKYFGKDVTTK